MFSAAAERLAKQTPIRPAPIKQTPVRQTPVKERLNSHANPGVTRFEIRVEQLKVVSVGNGAQFWSMILAVAGNGKAQEGRLAENDPPEQHRMATAGSW